MVGVQSLQKKGISVFPKLQAIAIIIYRTFWINLCEYFKESSTFQHFKERGEAELVWSLTLCRTCQEFVLPRKDRTQNART